uniref:glycosyltransferase family 2 protein n=1 Tax=Gemmiger qucibialis TaxID=2997294 RepID=UPI003FEF65E5
MISIIMPVYNAGVLLHTAVESVLRQSFADFELLLVDDGSTDGSAALAHELAKKDGRIRVLEQPNAGICAARNLGLQHCRGQWFTFCDDDDTMLPHALETLLVLAKSTGADVVRGGYRLLRANAAGTAVELPHPPGQAIIIHKPAGQGYLQFLQQSGPQFVWNAMYCTNRLGHLRFDETCRKGLEDFAFNAAVFQQADSAAYTPQIVYEHLERQGSTSACGNPAAVQVRLQYLPRWVQAEYTAARAWCPPQQLPKVWSARQAEFVTFVMHRCGMAACRPKPKRLPGAACSRRWQPAPTAGLTFGMHCGTIKNRVPHCFCSVPTCRGCMPACQTGRRNCYNENHPCYRRSRLYRPPCCKKSTGYGLPRHCIGLCL